MQWTARDFYRQALPALLNEKTKWKLEICVFRPQSWENRVDRMDVGKKWCENYMSSRLKHSCRAPKGMHCSGFLLFLALSVPLKWQMTSWESPYATWSACSVKTPCRINVCCLLRRNSWGLGEAETWCHSGEFAHRSGRRGACSNFRALGMARACTPWPYVRTMCDVIHSRWADCARNALRASSGSVITGG